MPKKLADSRPNRSNTRVRRSTSGARSKVTLSSGPAGPRPTKTCNKCGVKLVVGDNWFVSMAASHHHTCKVCHTTQTMKGRDTPKFRARQRKSNAAARLTPKGRAAALLGQAVRNSKKRGHPPPQLVAADLVPALERGVCAVTGIPFSFKPRAKGHQNPYAPSLDRPDSSRPYSRDNFRLILWGVNTGCWDWGLEVYLTIASRALGVSFKSTTGVTP